MCCGNSSIIELLESRSKAMNDHCQPGRVAAAMFLLEKSCDALCMILAISSAFVIIHLSSQLLLNILYSDIL